LEKAGWGQSGGRFGGTGKKIRADFCRKVEKSGGELARKQKNGENIWSSLNGHGGRKEKFDWDGIPPMRGILKHLRVKRRGK